MRGTAAKVPSLLSDEVVRFTAPGTPLDQFVFADIFGAAVLEVDTEIAVLRAEWWRNGHFLGARYYDRPARPGDRVTVVAPKGFGF